MERSVSIERNVMFNPKDLQLQGDENIEIYRDTLNEGEREKIIQPNIDTHLKDIKHAENNAKPNEQNPENDNLILPELPQSIPKPQRIYDILPEPEPNTGCGM
jgi:hypothetical protein